jgi:hypothetical protein
MIRGPMTRIMDLFLLDGMIRTREKFEIFVKSSNWVGIHEVVKL